MFTDEFLEKVFSDDEVQKCPLGTQSTMIRAIERLLEESERNGENATIHQSELF